MTSPFATMRRALRPAALLSLSLSACGAPDLASAPAADGVRGAQSVRYLFGLTEARIAAVGARYAPGAPLDQLRAQVNAPFDCARYGDLCEEVGPVYGAEVLRRLWERAEAGADPSAIERGVSADLDTLGDRFSLETYPDGIPDRSPYFFFPGPDAPNCGVATAADNGTFRVRVRAYRINLSLYSTGRFRTEHFDRRPNGTWSRARAARLESRVDVVTYNYNSEILERFSATKVVANDSSVTAAIGQLTRADVEFVDGCGGAQEGSAVWACACAGSL